MRSLKLQAALLACQLWRTVDAAFGLASKGNSFSVDTNAGLVFDVSK